MLTVRALCVCVSIVTRAYGLIVTGCSVGGVSLITELVLWLSCSTSNIGESLGISPGDELPWLASVASSSDLPSAIRQSMAGKLARDMVVTCDELVKTVCSKLSWH